MTETIKAFRVDWWLHSPDLYDDGGSSFHLTAEDATQYITHNKGYSVGLAEWPVGYHENKVVIVPVEVARDSMIAHELFPPPSSYTTDANGEWGPIIEPHPVARVLDRLKAAEPKRRGKSIPVDLSEGNRREQRAVRTETLAWVERNRVSARRQHASL